jgi:hypothetical protein
MAPRMTFSVSTFLLPVTPRALPSFFATTEALSPPGYSSSGPQTTDHERCSLSRFVILDSYRSNFRPFYPQPPDALLSFCSLLWPGIGRGIVAPPLRNGFQSWLRHRKGGLANASGRIEFNIVLFMDWSFASGCSPPRLSTTQLPSATDRPVFPSGRDFHPSVGAYFQAHLSSPFGAGVHSISNIANLFGERASNFVTPSSGAKFPL